MSDVIEFPTNADQYYRSTQCLQLMTLAVHKNC